MDGEGLGGRSAKLQRCEDRFGYHPGPCFKKRLPGGGMNCCLPLTDVEGAKFLGDHGAQVDPTERGVPFLPEPSLAEQVQEAIEGAKPKTMAFGPDEPIVREHFNLAAGLEAKHIAAGKVPSFGWRFGFSLALMALKEGGKVRRQGWNGKGMWIAMQVPGANSKMTHPYLYIEYPEGHPAYPNGSRVPWLASQTDLLACDWEVVP